MPASPAKRRSISTLLTLLCALATVQITPQFARADEPFKIVDPVAAATADDAKVAPRYSTFAHRALDIDADEIPVSSDKYALLDSLIDDVRDRISYDPKVDNPREQEKQVVEILQTIDDVLTDHGFLYPPDGYDVDSLRSALAPQHYDRDALERILKVETNQRRREHAHNHPDGEFFIIDCDIGSILYVGIAEALGLELHLVDLPDHMVVRWLRPGGGYLNWDTNDAQIVPDKTYTEDYHFGKRIRRQRIYMATMTPKEEEGYLYFLRAIRLEDRNRDHEAIADLERVGELYPQSTQARSELAWLYATAADVDPARRKRAVELAQACVHLEPKCADFWDSLAAAHAAQGDFKRAVAEARKAESFAESNQDRGEFRSHRKSFERRQMPQRPHPH